MNKNLQKGALSMVIALFASSCYYQDIPREENLLNQPAPSVCLGTDLSVSATVENASGCDQADAKIITGATGGSGDYSFSIDGGATKQVSEVFENLTGGTYLIIAFDGSLCTDSTEVIVNTAGTDFSASINSTTPDSDCFSANGSIEVQAVGGSGSYTFQLGTKTNATGVFSNLAAGSYTVAVSDGSCSASVSTTISSESDVSYVQDIVPILTAKCNDSKCHGDGSAQASFTTYESVKANAANIKARTADGSMPKQPKPGGDLTTEQIKLIACWVDDGAKNN